MSKKLLLFSALLLSGCKISDPSHWSNAQENYECTIEQWKIVEDQALFCKENTEFNGMYCLGTAITRNCTFKVQP